MAADWIKDHTAGTGPYILAAWRRGVDVVYEPNPHSWRPFTNRVRRIVIKRIHEAGSQRLPLEKGDLDIAVYVAPDAVAAVEKNPGVRVYKTPSFFQEQILWNTAAGPLKDRRVRQALAHAWDLDTYAQFVHGQTAPPEGAVPNTTVRARLHPPQPVQVDMARAKALLAEGGYPPRWFTTRCGPAPRPGAEPMPSYSANFRSWDHHAPGGGHLAGNERARAALGHLPGRRRPDPRRHLLRHAGDPAPVVDADQHVPLGLPPAQACWVANFGYYANPEVDRLMDEAQSTLDPPGRGHVEASERAAHRRRGRSCSSTGCCSWTSCAPTWRASSHRPYTSRTTSTTIRSRGKWGGSAAPAVMGGGPAHAAERAGRARGHLHPAHRRWPRRPPFSPRRTPTRLTPRAAPAPQRGPPVRHRRGRARHLRRVVHGTRLTLSLSLFVVALSLVLGSLVGSVAGMAPRWLTSW